MTTTTDPYVAGLEARGLIEWVTDPDWSMVPALVQDKRCRHGGGFHNKACGRPAVAALKRSRGRRPSWWAYCEEHLYGRRLVDGVVLGSSRKPEAT